MADPATAPLDPPTRALVTWADKVTHAPWDVADADLEALRAHGFDDTAILEATHVVGFFNHINRLADALGVDLEPGMPPAPRPAPTAPADPLHLTVAGFQRLIADQFGARDAARGLPGNWMWFTEEVGELARALAREDRPAKEREFADVLAWLCSLATLSGVDLAAAALKKYGAGCPRCRATPCACPPAGTNAMRARG